MATRIRRDRILELLVAEYRDSGHSILTEEEQLYAGIVAVVGEVRIMLAKINLDTLADQIDRSLS